MYRLKFLGLLLCLILLPWAMAQDANEGWQVKSVDANSYNKAFQLFEQARSLMNANKLNEAEVLLKKAIQIAPNVAETKCNLGVVYCKQGRYQEAETELKEALAIKPTLAAALLSLGATYQTTGRTKQAIEAYKKYLSMAPKDENFERTKNMVSALEGEMIIGEGGNNYDSDYLPQARMVGIGRWPKSKIPISVFIRSGDGVPGYLPDYKVLLLQSFNDWQIAAGGMISFVFPIEESGARIVCTWTDDASKLLNIAEGGHAHVVPNKEGIDSVDIFLYTKSAVNQDAHKDKMFHRLCLHEIGHALGLLGHSPNADDIMFASVIGTNKEPIISLRDRNTLLKLYSVKDVVHERSLNTAELTKNSDPKVSSVSSALNAAGVAAMKSHNFSLATSKLNEACNLDPKNDLIRLNLGICYLNQALILNNAKNSVEAEKYFKESISTLEGSSNLRGELIRSLTDYMIFLKRAQRYKEAAAINTSIRTISEQLSSSESNGQ